LNQTSSTLSVAVQLRSSHDTISTMGESLESDLVVLTEILNLDRYDYVGPDVELAVYAVNNAVAPATK
jgi:hypothetical protein